MNASNIAVIARAAEQAADQLGTAVDTLSDTDAGRGFGETMKDVFTNKYVVGGIAAVVVAGAAYGTYRYIKGRSDKKAAAPAAATPAAPAVPMTPEEKVIEARRLLTEAESKLVGKPAPQVAQAA